MAHRRIMMAALIACAGIAVPALAQDSVSNNGAPQALGDSDALSPWDGASANTNYILNLTPFTSSWGTTFATAPLAKSSRSASGFESSLLGAQAISRNVIDAENTSTFSAWRVAGQGTHATENDAPSSVLAPAQLKQFGFVFTEFATSDVASNVANIIGGVANVFPNNSCKLYVNRVVAMTNSSTGTTNSAALNIGTVDASGNIAIRADDFGALGPDPILGNNIVIVDTQSRSAVVNQLSRIAGVLTAADAAATTLTSIMANGDAHSTPGLIPEDDGGPVYIGTNFNDEYVYNNGASTDLTHLPGLTTQRGTLAYSSTPLFGGATAVGSAGTLAKSGDPFTSPTRSFSIWDVDATGAIVGTATAYHAPTGLDDPCETGDDAVWNAAFSEIDHYHSQVPFNGGNSPLALGQDQSGSLLAAGIAYLTGGDQDETNGIAVLRDTDPGAAGGESWSLAAWNGDPNFIFTEFGRGKPVLDGPGGNVIGYMSTLFESTDGVVLGPSISGCSFDSVGNLWFVSPVEFPNPDDGNIYDAANIRVTLLRAVYNANGGGGGEACWELEAVMSSGDVFHGANSDTDYLVGFINIADSNSVASGTLWSQNSSQEAYAGMSTVGMATSDARASAGVLLSTSIVYDSDNDGMFSFDSELIANGDESYNVIMYIGANAGVCADLNSDNVIDTADLGTLIAQFGTAGASADLNCDGVVDTADLGSLIAEFGNACN